MRMKNRIINQNQTNPLSLRERVGEREESRRSRHSLSLPLQRAMGPSLSRRERGVGGLT
jgi:hypothetical protein